MGGEYFQLPTRFIVVLLSWSGDGEGDRPQRTFRSEGWAIRPSITFHLSRLKNDLRADLDGTGGDQSFGTAPASRRLIAALNQRLRSLQVLRF
jgi:hypothetical protein